MRIKKYNDLTLKKNNKKIQYIRYRVGNIKHDLWLKSRKSEKNVYIDRYDEFILENLNTGKTAIFGNAGYYLEDCIKDLTVLDTNPIVKDIYPKAIIVKDRAEIGEIFFKQFDNFIVTNRRSDLWVNLQGLISHMTHYRKSMKQGCNFFYTFRDTQITPWNRLKENHYEYFLNFAKTIEQTLSVKCLHSTIDFANGDGNENPDTTNGNIKYLFKCIK